MLCIDNGKLLTDKITFFINQCCEITVFDTTCILSGILLKCVSYIVFLIVVLLQIVLNLTFCF